MGSAGLAGPTGSGGPAESGSTQCSATGLPRRDRLCLRASRAVGHGAAGFEHASPRDFVAECQPPLEQSDIRFRPQKSNSPVTYATIGPIAIYLPEKVESNEQLQAEFPKWDMPLIYSRTGIAKRHIAAEDETAADLGVAACKRLFAEQDIDPRSIDFLLLCTQTPDYPLPTTACLMQDRLGMRMESGALDFNLGCSGFVYGLALADGLIRSGAAGRVLLVTAETYSKYIDPSDRSLRTIFGDAAAATLIESTDEPSLHSFQFGTDGSGADTLFVAEGGPVPPKDALQPRHRRRWPSDTLHGRPQPDQLHGGPDSRVSG